MLFSFLIPFCYILEELDFQIQNYTPELIMVIVVILKSQ